MYYQRYKKTILQNIKNAYTTKKDTLLEKNRRWREENPEKIKMSNALWYSKNAEYERKKKNAYANTREGKLCIILKSAKASNRIISMTDNEIMDMTDMPCRYCNHKTIDGIYRNGIDRMNSSIGYDLDNCISCCRTCNISKGQIDSFTFVERARQISLHHGGSGNITDKWSNFKRQSFVQYKNRTIKEGKVFELSREEFEELRAYRCNYCWRACTKYHSNGIDCVDSNPYIGYVLTNCVSCCRDCNFMKNTQDVDDFISHMKKIAKCEYVFPDMPRMLTTFSSFNHKK
jgi:hypothetical protein